MKVTECNSVEVSIVNKFTEKYVLKDKNILLNTILVYGLRDKCIEKEINFEIKCISNEFVVYPLEKSEEYIIIFNKLATAKKVEIKAEEFLRNVPDNGIYTFYI